MKKKRLGASSEENKESQNPYHIKDSGFLVFTEIIFGMFSSEDSRRNSS